MNVQLVGAKRKQCLRNTRSICCHGNASLMTRYSCGWSRASLVGESSELSLYEDEIMLSENDIRQDVEAELKWSPDVDDTDIAVKVNGGAVTLTGYVRHYSE